MSNLVVNYSSSEDEIDASEGQEIKNQNLHASQKRQLKLTKSELKERRKKRKAKGPWGSWDSSSDDGEEQGTCSIEDSEMSLREASVDSEAEDEDKTETSNFYGDSLKDYKNRSFLFPPTDIDIDLHKPSLSFKCFIPKKHIYTYEGHLNGTTELEFFPKTGHMFLSGGNDNILRLWDFYHDRRCIRDYKGHSKAIKSLKFSDDGISFLSSSYDQYVKAWDIETGKVKHKVKLNSIPNDVKYRPLNPEEFIVGLSNSKINHFDQRVPSKNGLVQVYDHHQGSILYLKYFPDGTKFISSSEDKTVRIWENKINIPIKQISDTSQYSMPYIEINPQGHYFSTQSMDNTIYSYGMKPKYKKHPKKSFKGHESVGYKVGLGFSPDGKYLASGDIKSRIFIWDWTTTRLMRSIVIPDNKPVTQVAWNPQETSKILCSGNSGYIYLYD